MKWINKILRERTLTRVIFLSLFVFMVGIGLIAASTYINDKHIAPLFNELGRLLLVTVSISLLWELWAKRAFFDETWERAGSSHELSLAGLKGYTEDFNLVPFQDFLENINRLDIFFSYGATWRNYYSRQLTLIAQTKGARIRVILPDPEDRQVIAELSRRFEQDRKKLIGNIIDAKDYFLNELHRRYPDGSSIAVWYISRAPHHTFYIMDKIAVVSLYNLQMGRGLPVPTFTVSSGGMLYKFVLDEFEHIVNNDRLSRIVNE